MVDNIFAILTIVILLAPFFLLALGVNMGIRYALKRWRNRRRNRPS